jgi:hypothetical protein
VTHISMTHSPTETTTGDTTSPRRDEGGQVLLNRIRLLCALALSAVVFWHFGWWVARPVDPLGAISLLNIRDGQIVVTMAELLGLSVVVSGLAVAICGAGSAARGPLAVAVGLATLNLRGAQMDGLVLSRLLDANKPEGIFPVFALVSETWLWLALVGVGFVVGRWVESWFGPDDIPAGTTARSGLLPAIDFRQAAGSTVVSFAIAWIVLGFTVGGSEAAIEKGQIYFAVAFSFLIATLLAAWFFEVRTPGWSLVVVGLVATLAYTFGAPDITVEQLQARTYLNVTGAARPLPIEFAALGAVGVLIESDVMAMCCAMIGIHPPDRGEKKTA